MFNKLLSPNLDNCQSNKSFETRELRFCVSYIIIVSNVPDSGLIAFKSFKLVSNLNKDNNNRSNNSPRLRSSLNSISTKLL